MSKSKPSGSCQPLIKRAAVKELRDLLMCPVCLVVPQSKPIYQCDNGHVVCKECFPRLRGCPTCRAGLRLVRNLFCERFVERVPLGCQYDVYGCKVRMLNAELPAHELECRFRVINCPVSGCRISPSIPHMMEHIDTNHLGACVTWERYGYPHFVLVKNEAFVRDETLRPIHYRYDDKHFFFECQRDNTSGMWFVWVYVVDSVKVAKRYTCCISLRNESGSDGLSYTGPVVSLEVPFSQVRNPESVWAFNDVSAKRISLKNQEFVVDVKIRREGRMDCPNCGFPVLRESSGLPARPAGKIISPAPSNQINWDMPTRSTSSLTKSGSGPGQKTVSSSS